MKAFLLEMKERDILMYPDSLVDASLSLLANSSLLSVFMTIVFKKTNAYDANTLKKCMDLISKWMNHLEASE